MMNYGVMHAYFQNYPETRVDSPSHNFDFGNPQNFLPQRTIAFMRAKVIATVGISVLVASVVYKINN
jgi:hypothetical protein